MKTLREVFRYNLKKYRREAGMEQIEFAAKLGVPYSTYQKMESKKGSIPQKAKLKKIVEALELKTETLLFQDPELPPHPDQTLEAVRKALFPKPGTNT